MTRQHAAAFAMVALWSVLGFAACEARVNPLTPSAPVVEVVTPAPAPAPTPVAAAQTICATTPEYGGNDVYPPVGGCFGPGLKTRAEVEAIIAKYPQYTWGLSGHGFAWPQQLPDGTWIVAVTK